MQGHITIKAVDEGDDWTGDIFKTPGTLSKLLKMKIGGDGEVDVYFRGCGKSYNEKYPLEEGFVEVDINDVVSQTVMTPCILEGVVISPVYADHLFTVLEIHTTTYHYQRTTRHRYVRSRYM